jgi:formate/nitrite transporter
MLRGVLGRASQASLLRVRAPPLRRFASTTPHKDLAHTVGELGLVRGGRSFDAITASSVLGGVFLSFSGCFYLTVHGGSTELRKRYPGFHALISALVFPSGLAMISLCGSDLLTSAMMYCVAPFYTHAATRNVNLRALARVWAASLGGNLAGSVLMAGAAAGALVPPNSPAVASAIEVAEKKAALPAGVAFVRAVGANFLVNTAIVMTIGAQSAGGKIAALWAPITIFVALGLEHSVANMFFLPMGMFVGANIGVADIAGNLVPVIAGNAVGAFLLTRLLVGTMPLAAALAAKALPMGASPGALTLPPLSVSNIWGGRKRVI